MMQQEFDHIQRPLKGPDIESWRTRHGLNMDDASYALGIANYKKKLSTPGLLDFSLELLMRLYDENPQHGSWPRARIGLRDLFEALYGDALIAFKGTDHQVTARVDLQERFAKLFGRSKGRAYRWLDENGVDASITSKSQDVVQFILANLSQVEDPASTFERLGSFVWKLRGEDIDQLCPIPTLQNPPVREKRGRKKGSKIRSDGQARRVIAPMVKVKLQVKEIPRIARPASKKRVTKVKKT